MAQWKHVLNRLGRDVVSKLFKTRVAAVSTIPTFLTLSLLYVGSVHFEKARSTKDATIEKKNYADGDDLYFHEAIAPRNYSYHKIMSLKDTSFNSVQKNHSIALTTTAKAINGSTGSRPFLFTKCEPATVERNTDVQPQPHSHNNRFHVENLKQNENQNHGNRIIFLGSGSSTGCPRPLCPLLFSDIVTSPSSDATSNSNNINKTLTPELIKLREDMINHCRTSILASRGNPINNKDYRNNPSLLISVLTPATPSSTAHSTSERYNVIIDVGKTFREGAIRWLPTYHIRTIDAIVLTHQHMDAAGGLDDVRGFQKYNVMCQNEDKSATSAKAKTARQRQAVPMPLFLSDSCLSSLQDQFPWLLPKKMTDVAEKLASSTPDQSSTVQRHVASFDVNIFSPFKSFEPVPGLKFTSLPLIHGEDLISYGFAFTLGETMNVVYLSDISRMLPETLDYIQNHLPQPTHLLILDSLLIDSSNPVHYCLPQTIKLIEQLQPLQTYLVGMNCDSFGPHDQRNNQLQKDYGNVQLAHDGLVIDAPDKKEINEH